MSRRTTILDAQFEMDRMFDALAELREDEDERRRLFDVRIGHINRNAVQLSEMFRSLMAIEDQPARAVA